MSAKALQHGWEHEIQMALLRRRAAMTRAVSPNMSAREQWLLAGLKDTATHWVQAPRELQPSILQASNRSRRALECTTRL